MFEVVHITNYEALLKLRSVWLVQTIQSGLMLDYLLNGIIQVSECLNFSGNAVDNSW